MQWSLFTRFSLVSDNKLLNFCASKPYTSQYIFMHHKFSWLIEIKDIFLLRLFLSAKVSLIVPAANVYIR